MNFFLQLVVSGAMLGAVYSLIALGFVIISKSSGVVNFAQGQLVAVGALILWTLAVALGLPLWFAGVLSIGCCALLGVIIERLTIRPMTGQAIVSVIIMTLGIATLLDSLMAALFGTVERALPATFPSGGLLIGGISIAYEYLFSFIIASIMVGFFLYFFQYTRLGLNMRAVADGHDKARSCGVKVGAIFRLAWAISAVSAMMGGFLLGNIESVSINLSGIALRVFPVIVLGGIDSVRGCIVAGPIVGILEILTAGYVDPITQGGAGDVMASVIIVLTLIFKPYGIFGQAEIERI